MDFPSQSNANCGKWEGFKTNVTVKWDKSNHIPEITPNDNSIHKIPFSNIWSCGSTTSQNIGKRFHNIMAEATSAPKNVSSDHRICNTVEYA